MKDEAQTGNDEGLTYMFQGQESGRIKIGFTEGAVQDRLKAVQTGCWERLEIVGWIEGDVEGALHRKFRALRTAGGTEWFTVDGMMKRWWETDPRIRHLRPLADCGGVASSAVAQVDVLDEQIVTLKEACKLLPRRNGRRMHVATVYRWSVAGVRGVVLETIQVGGARCTSLEAIRRFCEELTYNTGVRRPRRKRARISADAAERVRRAERELVEAGIA